MSVLLLFVLTAGETRTAPIAGVTAAWAIDPAVVAIVVKQDGVTVVARAAGSTTIVLIGAAGEQRYRVVVNARAGSNAARAPANADQANVETRYSSAGRELQNSVTTMRTDGTKRTEVSVRTIHHAGNAIGDRANTSIASASYRIFTGNRELTFLDREVDHSPLTLDATPLRGIHYLDEHWRLHAGYTAYATYRSFLVPVERELVAGGGYAFRAGAQASLTPSLFAIRGKGTIASLMYENSFARTELAYSHGLGGAAEVAWDGLHDRVRASVRYRPDDFAVAGTATPRGFFGDALWTHTYARDSALSLSSSATDVLGMRVLSGAADLDHRVNRFTSLLGGASWASFDGRRTLTVPAGVRLDFPRGGITALARYTRAFNNEGGFGFRVAGRVSAGRFFASAFIDQQRSAPTLDVIFSERPDLALALAELGIVATSPADVARALRELGFVKNITLNLAPTRTQAGFEAALRGARQEIRARVLRNVTESVTARTTTLIATLSYSHRLTNTTDVFASWTYWRVQPFFEVGIRQRFDALPAMFGGSGTISGVVVLDGRGVVADVELDGSQRQQTGEDGAFAFRGVSRGSHVVVARMPDRGDVYFTTPSRIEASPGDRIEFSVASMPARLFGRVASDGGDPIAGVHVLLTRGVQRLETTSGSDGRFTFAAPPGEWEIAIVAGSVPPGYSLIETKARSVMLDLAAPANVEWTLPALKRRRHER